MVAVIFDKNNIKWERNWKGFGYINEEGKNRKFYPDFYLSDYDVYIEYKGWTLPWMEHKMKDAVDRNKFNLLIIYGKEKRVKNIGLCLGIIEEDNNVLLNVLSNMVAMTRVAKGPGCEPG